MMIWSKKCNLVGLTEKEMVELLIAKGADINARGNDGETALSLAQKRGKTAVVQVLSNRGRKGSE